MSELLFGATNIAEENARLAEWEGRRVTADRWEFRCGGIGLDGRYWMSGSIGNDDEARELVAAANTGERYRAALVLIVGISLPGSLSPYSRMESVARAALGEERTDAG